MENLAIISELQVTHSNKKIINSIHSAFDGKNNSFLYKTDPTKNLIFRSFSQNE